MRALMGSMAFLLVIFILPALIYLGLWAIKDQPRNWRQANWSSAGILPAKPAIDSAEIYLMTARVGGLKGAFASHSWIVLKREGAPHYDRYDVVGWGRPVRKNAYAADAFWYSNAPEIRHYMTGHQAALLIPQIEDAIKRYKWREHGDYVIWPGPNSNSFIATILDEVPALNMLTDGSAVGRDFPADGRFIGQRKSGDWFISFAGYAGVVMGKNAGLELNFLGLVAGLNPFQRSISIPAFGTFVLNFN